MSGIESPTPPPASSYFDLKKSPLQCLVLLTLWNLTESQPKIEQLWACFALNNTVGIRFPATGGNFKSNFSRTLMENQEEDWLLSLHFCNLTYIMPVSAISVSKCGLKILMEFSFRKPRFHQCCPISSIQTSCTAPWLWLFWINSVPCCSLDSKFLLRKHLIAKLVVWDNKASQIHHLLCGSIVMQAILSKCSCLIREYKML